MREDWGSGGGIKMSTALSKMQENGKVSVFLEPIPRRKLKERERKLTFIKHLPCARHFSHFVFAKVFFLFRRLGKQGTGNK